MGALHLADLRPHPLLEAELRWYFTESDGEQGLRSNYGAMVSKLQLGVRGGSTPVHCEIDNRAMEAAEKARHIRRALEGLETSQYDTLRLAYGQVETEAPAALQPFGSLLGLIGHTAAAEKGHRNSNRSMIEWLVRLVKRAQVETKARLLEAAIRREAELQLLEATRAYSGARGRYG